MFQNANSKIDLSVIIVAWKVKDLLEKCLSSIYSKSKGINFACPVMTSKSESFYEAVPRGEQSELYGEVFVIDNNSGDGSVEMIKTNFPQVKLIINQKNKGFASANNQGIKEAKGEFILLLNPDTEILDNALSKMVNFMKEREEAGITGCRLLNSDHSLQPSCRAFPSLYSQIIVLLKLHNFFPALVKKYYMLDWPHQEIKEVDQVMGACFLIRKKVINEIGLLDENFYIWFEEVDFCKRAKDKGWKIYYTPQIEIIHHQGQSFKQVIGLEKQKEFNRSLRYYFKKRHSFISYLIISIFNPISLFLAYLIQIMLKLKIKYKI